MAKWKSIIQPDIKECYLCRLEAKKFDYYDELPSTGLHKHHFMHGTADRELAEKYGLYAYVCVKRHHEYGSDAPHANAEVDMKLKKIAQEKFEEIYGHDKWMEVFMKNYL